MDNLFLIGFMGSGKSTIAQALKRKHHMSLVEMDQVIEERAGMPIPEIFEKYGEEYFRNLESELVADIQNLSGQVVSCGGGVVLRQENVDKMRASGKVVLLQASPQLILKRVQQNDNRPVLQGKKNLNDITKLMEQRKIPYENAADFTVNIDGKTVNMICEEIMMQLER